MAGSGLSRRQFIGGTIAGGLFTITPRYALGGPGQKAPSDVLTRAVIGPGGRGGGFVYQNRENEPDRTIAVCDVDKNRLLGAQRRAGGSCKAYGDFRRVMDHDDIDVVYIATPPHWHALISIAAAQAGKDIYCEKPMTKFIHEGRAVVETVARYRRIFQIGTFGRFGVGSGDRTRKIMLSGVIQGNGPVIRTHHGWKVAMWSGRVDQKPEPVPKELDYNLWLGPAPFKPYFRHRTHGSFRGYWDYDGGGLADMGQHFLDGRQYELAKDDTGPVEIEASAPRPAHDDAVRMWAWVSLKYADGTTLMLDSNEWGRPCPLQERGMPTLTPDQEKVVDAVPDAPRMYGHGADGFEEAVKLRKQCGGNAEAAHRCATLLHLSNIAIRLGRKLHWDPETEQFVGDEEANRLVDIPMRAPWSLPA
jgi:myo-inositol 2-dehydrogenase/D-chiro-inositol 1-dehydrogenase